MNKQNITVGAIRWDAWYGHDGDPCSVISQVENTLSPAEFHHRAPFFARVTDTGRIEIPAYTQEIFDREMEYAADAGIDYFTFVWYGDIMRTARRFYKNCPLKNKVRMSVCMHALPYTEEEREELLSAMAEDWFMKTDDGRPLIYYFATRDCAEVSINYLRERCAERGIKKPYSVVMNISVEDTRSCGADAIGQYGSAGANGETFAQLADDTYCLWENFRKTGMSFVPTVSTGWHNLPRYVNPVAWIQDCGPDGWAEYPTGKEIEMHLMQAFRYLEREDVKKQSDISTLSIYAWNEHDEGGWFCPTIEVDENGNQLFGHDGIPRINTERLDGVKRAIMSYRHKKEMQNDSISNS